MDFFWIPIFIVHFECVFSYSFEDLDLNGINYGKNEIFGAPPDQEYYDDIYLPYLFDSGIGNREGLMINDITVDESFSLGKGVMNWNAILFGEWQYLIGRQEHSVKLIQVKIKHFTSDKSNTLHFKETVTKFEGTVGPIVLTAHINYSTSLEEGFALVTEVTGKHFQSIHWLKITTKGLVPYTTWSNPIRGEIIDLKWIKFDLTEFLLIVTCDDNNITTIDISEYKLEEDKMRLMCIDKVKVDYLVSSVSTVVQGEDLYIVLVAPHEQRVWLYRYHLNFYKVGGFNLLFGIVTPGVTAVSSFVQSGRKYFLINGKEANIYLLNHNGTFTPQLNYCDGVDEWLVLDVPTYRQDVILLARGGDKVSLLTWSGTLKGFTMTVQPQCFKSSHMDKLSHISDDASCLANCHWSGGAILKLGHFPSVILACNFSNIDEPASGVGGLFRFNATLHSAHGPPEDIANFFSRSQQLIDKVENLSQKFEHEGLLAEVEVSRGRLQESWDGNWNGLEQCFRELDDQVLLFSSYMDQRYQNNVSVAISLQQGHLVGTASGLMSNQSVQAAFKGKFGLQPDSGRSFNRVIIIDTDLVFGNNQHFLVKAKMNLDVLEVAERISIDGMRSLSGYGVSPEIKGPPQSYKSQVPYQPNR